MLSRPPGNTSLFFILMIKIELSLATKRGKIKLPHCSAINRLQLKVWRN